MKQDDIENKVAQHEVLFEVFEKRFDKLEDFLTNHIMSKLEEIEKSLHKRPSWVIAILLTIMSSIIIGLVTFLLTR